MAKTLVPPDRIPEWIPGALTMDSSARGWKGVTLKGYHYDGQAAVIPPMRDYMIVAYDGAPARMSRSSGGPWATAAVGRGRISLLTRAEQSTWAWDQPIQVRHIYLSHEAIETSAQSAFDRDPKSIEIADQIATDDHIILDYFRLLETELAQGALGQRLMIDSIRNLIAVHLLRRYASIQLVGALPSAFSAAQRQRVVDYIEAHLTEDISLDDLAEAVGLSAFHFSRQFKAAFGTSPYAFVIRKRIEKAQGMLRRKNVPHKVVAQDCGFSDQSHFCRTFRKVVGLTPYQFQTVG